MFNQSPNSFLYNPANSMLFKRESEAQGPSGSHSFHGVSFCTQCYIIFWGEKIKTKKPAQTDFIPKVVTIFFEGQNKKCCES